MSAIRDEWVSKDGQHRIILGDCLQVIPLLDTSEVAGTLADPPYGIDRLSKPSSRLCEGMSEYATGCEWDRRADVSWIPRLGIPSIVWGGNYFGLPATRCVLVWDKNNDGRDFADVEIAWTNLDEVARKMVVRPMSMDGGKVHPTQKPLAIIEWCLSFLPPGLILDPFAGSCTVAVACARTGRKSLSIEIERKYWEIGVSRMERELARHPLFEPPKPKQLELLP